jgi:hypothetical protein
LKAWSTTSISIGAFRAVIVHQGPPVI